MSAGNDSVSTILPLEKCRLAWRIFPSKGHGFIFLLRSGHRPAVVSACAHDTRSMESINATIFDLPEEVFLLIARQVPPQDLFNLLDGTLPSFAQEPTFHTHPHAHTQPHPLASLFAAVVIHLVSG